MSPRRSRGSDALGEAFSKLNTEESFPDNRACSTGLAATSPAEKTNEPTPMSIKEVPQVSTFAKRRGKTRKSTARIARHVIIIMPPLYAVMKGRIGSGLNFSSSESLPDCAGFATCLEGLEFVGRMNRAMAGNMRRQLRSTGLVEYIVMADRRHMTLRRKSASIWTGP